MISEEERNRLEHLAKRDGAEANRTDAEKAHNRRLWEHENEQARLAKEAHQRRQD